MSHECIEKPKWRWGGVTSERVNTALNRTFWA
jgi:hypothetical protein